ncbi:ATP-dependent Clp protease proteolytic subunit [Phaeacidiphilus oryzae]|uniref:ATP-dependent Clp protease proteolytic subunit n=1 Tax=Phaeacidiphilus oryzae TaxID=348818 RepID=UPI0007C70B61|nr:ATP-dependent Clp protease proteolytic subunit [Phaeacidiphilus oryzae]
MTMRPGFPGSPADADSPPYGRLLAERVAVLGGPLDDEAAGSLTAQLIMLQRADGERGLSLYINSPGGRFPAFAALHDTLRAVAADQPVETVCFGRAEGTAAALLAAGTPGQRLILPSALAVLRQPEYGEEDFARPREAESGARRVAAEHDRLVGLLAEYTGRTVERVRVDLERPLPMEASAAVGYGLADRIAHRLRPIPGRPAGRPGSQGSPGTGW